MQSQLPESVYGPYMVDAANTIQTDVPATSIPVEPDSPATSLYARKAAVERELFGEANQGPQNAAHARDASEPSQPGETPSPGMAQPQRELLLPLTRTQTSLVRKRAACSSAGGVAREVRSLSQDC